MGESNEKSKIIICIVIAFAPLKHFETETVYEW